jgi:hypothetical protein
VEPDGHGLESRHTVAEEIVIGSEGQHGKLARAVLERVRRLKQFAELEAVYPNVLVILNDINIVKQQRSRQPARVCKHADKNPQYEDQRANHGTRQVVLAHRDCRYGEVVVGQPGSYNQPAYRREH